MREVNAATPDAKRNGQHDLVAGFSGTTSPEPQRRALRDWKPVFIEPAELAQSIYQSAQIHERCARVPKARPESRDALSASRLSWRGSSETSHSLPRTLEMAKYGRDPLGYGPETGVGRHRVRMDSPEILSTLRRSRV